MQYEDMTDFEINKAVAEALYPDLLNFDRGGNVLDDGKTIFVLNSGWMDYCNTPSDAWPIIVENRIDIRHRYTEQGEDIAHATALIGDDEDYLFWSSGDNLLRCAMIVFLKMEAT